MLLLACSAAMAPLHAQRPWLSAESRSSHDSQSRTAVSVDAQHGRYLLPTLTLALHAGGSRITAPGSSTVTGAGALEGTWALPALRLGLQAAGGVVAGVPGEAGVVPVYSADASLNVGAGVSLRGRAVRERYTATVASLDTAVMAQRLEVALDRSAAPAWAGEAVARRETYGDDNAVSTAYLWVLAPVSRSAGHSVRIGYGAAWQDTPETRWRVDPSLPAGPTGELGGRYAPYYTPHDVFTHSALANAAVAVGAGWLLVNGSVGVHATEMAPALFGTGIGGAPALLTFHDRSFTPWRADASLVAPVGANASVTVAVEFSRTAYYRAGGFRLSMSRWL